MEMTLPPLCHRTHLSDGLVLYLALNAVLPFLSLLIALVAYVPPQRSLPSFFARYAFTVSVLHIGAIPVAALHAFLVGTFEHPGDPFDIFLLGAFVLLPSAGGLFLSYLVHSSARKVNVSSITPLVPGGPYSHLP